ncbi:hypothetical protein cypCar_00018925, partial [Cyprinus carpio]
APTHVLRCCQRGLAWIPVIFIALVVCWSYYAYVVELCLFTIPSTIEKVIYLTVFHVSFIMFVWSYWKTIFTRPATPSKELSGTVTAARSSSQTDVIIVLHVTCKLIVLMTFCFHVCTKDGSSLSMNDPPESHAKFHVLFLFFVAAMFCISILSLFTYHLWLVGKNRSTIEAFRAPVFRNGLDKNGFSLGFSKNIAQVFGDQKKYWLLPVFTSQGDGFSFPTRLVTIDPEQPTECLQPAGLDKRAVEDSAEQTSPLSESQNHLLSNAYHIEEDHKETDVLKSDENEAVTISIESES